MGLITYGNALVAQYYGAGNPAKCSLVTTQGVIIALASAPALLVMAYFGSSAFEVMGHDPAQVPLEQIYFQILMAGSVFTLIKACLASYFSGIGRTRVVMVSDVLGALLNIPLSWLPIFGRFGLPEMGIAGAALGTVIATVFTIGIYLLFYLQLATSASFMSLSRCALIARLCAAICAWACLRTGDLYERLQLQSVFAVVPIVWRGAGRRHCHSIQLICFLLFR